MKKTFFIVVILLLSSFTIFFSSCEKDEIKLPDLQPYRVDTFDYTWEDKIIVKHTTINSRYDMHDDDIIYGLIVYIFLAYENSGNKATSKSFIIKVLIDNIEKFSLIQTELEAGHAQDKWNNAVTNLSVGEHTIKMIVDADNEIIESDETNNEYSRTFIVKEMKK